MFPNSKPDDSGMREGVDPFWLTHPEYQRHVDRMKVFWLTPSPFPFFPSFIMLVGMWSLEVPLITRVWGGVRQNHLPSPRWWAYWWVNDTPPTRGQACISLSYRGERGRGGFPPIKKQDLHISNLKSNPNPTINF